MQYSGFRRTTKLTSEALPFSGTGFWPSHSEDGSNRYPSQAEEDDRKPPAQRADISIPVADLADQLDRAIGLLPEQNRSAFLEAIRTSPHLVRTETPLGLFLKRENGNVWAAASRVASYWRYRKAIFADRTFLSLDLNVPGELSALDNESLALLRSGFIRQLPNDDSNCSVFFFDRSRYASSWWHEKNPFLRCLFYWSNKAIQNPSSSVTSVVGIALLHVPSSSMYEKINIKPFLKAIQDAFPIKLKALHICFRLEAGQVAAFQNTVLPSIEHRLSKFKEVPIHIHVEVTGTNRLVLDLLKYGLTTAGLPRSMGGLLPDLTPIVEAIVPFAAAARQGVAYSLESQSQAAVVAPQCHAYGYPSDYSSRPIQLSVDLELVETLAIQQEGLRRLKDAIDLLPSDESAAYKSALMRVPHLIKLESDPIKFLRFEKYNSWAAAQRLALYWTKRVDIFGHRALFPLTLRGDGALNENEINSIESGAITLVPNDRRGRPVVVFDPEKRTHHDFFTRIRVVFYFFQVMSEQPNAQLDGHIGIVAMGRSTLRGARIDGNIREIAGVMTRIFPIHTEKLHLVNSPTGVGQRFFFEILVPVVGAVAARLNSKLVVHVGECSEIITRLESHGLSFDGLPDTIGGGWSYDQHKVWIAERLQLEKVLYRQFFASGVLALNSRNLSLGVLDALVAAPITPFESRGIMEDRTARSSSSVALVETYRQLEQHVAAIDGPIKEAYLEAQAKASSLVTKDSDPLAFLRFDEFKTHETACRILLYWKVRKESFHERAFLSLDQSGEGALGRKDVAVLSTAFLMSLPKDESEKAVVFCDGSRLAQSSHESCLRCTFYMLSIAAENPLSQTNGFVLIYVITDPSFDRAIKRCLEPVLEVIPARIHDVHIVECLAEADERSPSQKIEEEMVGYFRAIATNEVYIHPVDTSNGIAERLRLYGLRRSGLPKRLGGEIGVDGFSDWMELRLRYEWNLPPALSSKEEHVVFDFSAVRSPSEMNDEDKLDRKRKLNVIHSRRKRQRERIEIEVLQEQCYEERMRKTDLGKEHKRLQSLVDHAQTLVIGESGL